LYNDILAFKNAKLGSTARKLSEFLGISLSEASLPDFSRRIYGQGATFVPGADKIGRYRRQELFKPEHYDLIRGTWVEAAIEAFPGSYGPFGGRRSNRRSRRRIIPEGPATKDHIG
jgi:hypothetical protein